MIRVASLGLTVGVLLATVMPAVAREWALDASAFVFVPPDDDAILSPVVEGDRGVWHLEARYNYEDLDTGSAFAGRSFEFGKDVAWRVVPMVGLVLGQTDGVAPGVELEARWQKLTFFTESELVIDLEDSDASFVYSWLEVTVAATEWLSLGVVGQRTKAYETGLDIQRGPMIQASRGRGWLGFYWFNLDRPDDETFVFAGGWAF